MVSRHYCKDRAGHYLFWDASQNMKKNWGGSQIQAIPKPWTSFPRNLFDISLLPYQIEKLASIWSHQIDVTDWETLDSLKRTVWHLALQNVGRVQRSEGLFCSMLNDPKPVVICYYFHYFPGNWIWLHFLCSVQIWGDLPISLCDRKKEKVSYWLDFKIIYSKKTSWPRLKT